MSDPVRDLLEVVCSDWLAALLAENNEAVRQAALAIERQGAEAERARIVDWLLEQSRTWELRQPDPKSWLYSEAFDLAAGAVEQGEYLRDGEAEERPVRPVDNPIKPDIL